MSSRQKLYKVYKETSEINYTIDQTSEINYTIVYSLYYRLKLQLRDIPSKAIGYTFFSAAQGTFSQTDHILENKARLNKCDKIKIASCILSDYNQLKPEISNKINYKKYSWTSRIKNSLHYRRNEEIKIP
jgi:hypothetical protein